MSQLNEDLRVVLGLAADASPNAVTPRLIVRRCNATDSSGGAIAIASLIVVDGSLLTAPVDVRQAILAHELGHIRLGHTAAMSAAFVAAVLYAASSALNPPTPSWVLVNCALLCVLGAFALWATRPARELEADRYAATIVGREAVARALRWSIGSEPPTQLASKRLAALEAPTRR